jgi:putative membrane protein
VLADRFARGEIDEQEFRTRLAVLHETGPLAKR